ncbi:centromere-associated protein E isoform X2 [Halyomorpha halys]|uniref:centromere-associated protein E isoform X2 n=1 Tax=Halyomorpha halys TaxID=286706 RepID=UPI0034D2BBCA
MERFSHKNVEAAQNHVKHNFNFHNVHHQDISEGEFEVYANKTEKEVSSPRKKSKLKYHIDPSGEDYSSGYELEMEDTIVNLNDEIQKLHEELESRRCSMNSLRNELDGKNASIFTLRDELASKTTSLLLLQDELETKTSSLLSLQDELGSKNASISILQDELVKSRSSLLDLQCDLENANTNICELREELVKKRIQLNETEQLKINLNESIKKIMFLEQSLKEKSEALDLNNRLLETLKMEFDHACESAAMREKKMTDKEQQMRSSHENDIKQLKEHYSDKIKEILTSYSLKERFLENHIDALYSRITELDERGESHHQEYETFRKIYEKEYNEMKSKVKEIVTNCGSHIVEMDNRLAVSLSNEVALRIELNSKIDDEKKIIQELDDSKKKLEELYVDHKNTCKKLKHTEMQFNLLRENKEELQNEVLNTKNFCDKLKIDFIRERKQMEIERDDIVHSFETDLFNLIKALEDLYHCIKMLYLNPEEDLSNSDSDESTIKLSVISKEKFSNPHICAAMKLVCDSISESIKLRKELKDLVQNNQNLRIAFDARKKQYEDSVQQLASLKNEIVTLDKEKDCAVNNLRYVEEQNTMLKYEIMKKQSELDQLNEELLRYKDELDKISHQQQQQSETCTQLANVDLSPIVPDYKTASDSKISKDGSVQDIRSKSFSNNAPIQLATSTPYPKNVCDPDGGGEFIKPKNEKSKTEINLSFIKWMEKCHELDKENKLLTTKVESLTLQVQDLKFNSKFLKEEMNAYEEMRIKLEDKLSTHMSLKEQFTQLQDENEKLINETKNLNKELSYLKIENQELSKKNIQLEEKYGKCLIEFTENKNSDSNDVSSETVINNFNEKLQEILTLKGEIRSLAEDKKFLMRKIDLLHETNNVYCGKLEDTYNELILCKTELERIRNEKMNIYSDNKLLNKEVQLLQLRLDFLASMRDKSLLSTSNQSEELVQELIAFVRSIMESKFEPCSSFDTDDNDKEWSRSDKINFHEILKSLNHQLLEEKLDFEGKLKELQHIISISKSEGTIDDNWVVQLDKKLRTIFEELKFHKEQYNRIEEALRSTGKLLDDLQKHKDQLRIKDHEISNFKKKINEEKLQSKKFSCHLKYLQQELEEKNEIIKTSMDQKNSLEKELKELQYKLNEAERKYVMEIKAAEWKLQQAKLFNLDSEVERKVMLSSQKNEKCSLSESGSENWERIREEVEKVYQNALQQVQYYFNAELSSNVAMVQEEHKEQVGELQRIIDEQAIKIGILMKKNTQEDGLNNDVVCINDEYKKQFELATFALQQLHQEEIQLLKLQLEAEKHSEIYKAFYENEQNSNKDGIYMKSTVVAVSEKTLARKLENALVEDFTIRMQKFISEWHNVYKRELLNVKNKLQCGITKYLSEESNTENLKKIDNENQEILNQYHQIINSAKDFLNSLETEHSNIIKKLGDFMALYKKETLKIFDQIKIDHQQNNDLMLLHEELIRTKKEKEDLEKMHKNAIELLNADHRSEQDKIQILLTEIKQCFESGCDPNALIKLKNDLEERHKKELEDLRTYFEEKCASLGKQYSEDVNSLHSRMLSLSSSCSDDMLDPFGIDRGAAGDNNMFPDIELENATLEKLTTEQYKLIEELNYKWSENVKEMKKELENKYSKKIEELQDKLSTFVYNNELDITVRCIKEDVMRDCNNEIEEIKREISSRMMASADYSDYFGEKSDHKDELKRALCERDEAWEQIIDVMGNSLSHDAINKITIEIICDVLRKSDVQGKIALQVSELLTFMEKKLNLIMFKLKDKETVLFKLQNKINSCSKIFSGKFNKLKDLDKLYIKREGLEDNNLLEKLVNGESEGLYVAPEIVKMKNIFQELYEKKLGKEKEKQYIELETLKKYYADLEKQKYLKNSQLMEKLMKNEFDEQDWPVEIVQIKNILQQMFEKKLFEEKEKNIRELENIKSQCEEKESLKNVNVPGKDELDRIIEERDNLKEMTITLKTAVNQLVSYLNTCEDELNKTVVEELLKVYVETPKKSNNQYESLENTPDFRKVHFAPELGVLDLDSSQDVSMFIRLHTDSCLSKLKAEAASILGLTALQPPPANLNKQIENLRKENEELLHEISELKQRLFGQQNDSLELRDQFSDDLKKENSFTYLQDKAQQFLNGSQNIPQETVKVLEYLAKLGDNLIQDLQKEKIDLQQQIDAADKQLKSTRQFLEEQAAERETERDDYSKEIISLQAQLKEKGKNLSSQERFTTEVEELEQQLKESNMLLEECEKKKAAVDAELKEAIDKIWVLRDIISELESQLSSKSEKEALLEQKLDELESELDQQNGTQFAMAQELESLRSQSLDDGYLEQIKQLEENIKVQFNSSVVRQLKSQLRDLETTLEHRTKELETIFLNNSNNSLSSPSEEVSVREQLEWSRSRTPEHCPSPVALPVEEVSKLQDKFLRHVRAEEMLIKRLRDQQLITVKLQVELEEMHAERDVLQKQMKKQMTLLAEANNKIDDFRHKVETAQTSANKELISQIQELKEKYSKAEQALDSTHNQLMEYKIQLSHAEEIISKQKIEISNLAHYDHEMVDSLRLELAAVTAERNKLEDMLEKYKRDYNLDVVNALLVDKNEDIDHLQRTVSMLQSQKEDEDQQGSCNSKGYRVSFAADIENSSSLAEDMRLRDAPNMQSLDLCPDSNFQVFGSRISPIPHENEEKQFNASLRSFSLSDDSILEETENENEDVEVVLEELRSQVQEKSGRILSLEKEIEYLKSIEEDLKNTKSELEAVVSSITDDKKYYENELHLMMDRLSKKEEEVKKLRSTVKHKDEEIYKTTADVQSLREISLNLQEKLREAKELAEKENNHILKEDIAHLNEELLSKEKEISELEHELQLFKNDYNDEKELCETLKSSLNAITAEKQYLEENISSLRQENREVMNNLQLAEDRLNQYIIAVRNLKNDLSSRSNLPENKSSSSCHNPDFIENEIATLQEEIVKLINSNENFLLERNTVLEEINKLKSTINSEEYDIKDSLISQLQDELNDLKNAVQSIKEEKLEVFANFSKEICQLHKDIENLQYSKQEALLKWKQELMEKQAVQKQFESLKSELETEKNQKEQDKLSILSKKQRLTICNPNIFEIPPINSLQESKIKKLTFCRSGFVDIQPVSDFPGIDALADKMRKEIKLSATLDNSLLESILPESSEPCASASGQYGTITSKLRTLEKALLLEMEKAREARKVLREKEKKFRVSEAEKNELKLRIERLGRMLAAHEEKIGMLSHQLKTEKDKVITLELMVSKEQGSLKKVNTLLEEERNKARESQKDDIALIETMRKRLQALMENETILKQMVRDERQKCHSLQAQLNSARALEQYRSDSEDENHKELKTILLQERDKYFKLKVEYEKERRTCEDLREVLARERTAMCCLRDNLAKSEKHKYQIEKENTALKQRLNEEIVKRELADKGLVETKAGEDSRFQKHLQAIEQKNKKSLDAAYAVIRELEQEYNDLKIYIRSQQEQDEKWKDQVHLPLIQQLNEVNDNLDALIKERVELKRTIERLNEENNRLHNLIDELRRTAVQTERLAVPATELQIPNLRLQTESDVLTPFVEKEVDNLLDRVLRAESHKKALVFQKRYLMVALRGYQDAHAETLNQLRWHAHNRQSFRKFSFRSVVLFVIATFKIRKLPMKRMGTYHKKRDTLHSTMKRSMSRSSAEVERLTSAPTSRRIAPHSPPSRDRANLRFR